MLADAEAFNGFSVDNLARATFKDPAGNILSVIQA